MPPGQPQGLAHLGHPTWCHQMIADAVSITAPVPAMSPFQQSPDLGTGQQTPITTPQIAPTAPGFEGFFSSFLCKLCINVNDFLILKILKFTKRKYIKFFHLLIFLSRISPASRQAAGKLRDSHAHSTQAASPSSRPSS